MDKGTSKGAGFFHIDRRVWKMLCGRDDMHQAAAYLTVAAGTGRGNKISKWSAQAVETYTGLHSSRAKVAITELVKGGYLSHAEEHRRTVPIYHLESFDRVHEIAHAGAAAGGDYAYTVAKKAVRDGITRDKGTLKWIAPLLLSGLIWEKGGKYTLKPEAQEEVSELIWLPNTIVTGTSAQEPSPLKRLRQSGDLWALRLLIDLYHAQNLSADGGISREAFRGNYTRKQYGQRGRHIVWGFTRTDGPNSSWASSHPATEAFWQAATITGKYETEKNKTWPAMQTLTRMGLVTCVPHLVENSAANCEPIHGCAWDGSGELVERQLAQVANNAGEYIIGEQRLYTATTEGAEILVPVWDTQPDVQMAGIYRLTYRPQTSLTSDWLRRVNEGAFEWQTHYENLCPPGAVKATGTYS
jgi:hypothetical protein